jgi:hypothetical protein
VEEANLVVTVRVMKRSAARRYALSFVALLIASLAGSTSYGQEKAPGTRQGKLSEAMILNKNTTINFFEPPKEILVNYKMLKTDFQLYNGMVTFRLEGTQKHIHLECGLSDYGTERTSNQLTVIGDGNELLSRVYNAGENAGVSDVSIQGVHALTFRLGGTANGFFYCKDEISY